tara:strand:+ start:151 stop:567 length:417 start_codon:yes stop_codon:yes gene_type:complete
VIIEQTFSLDVINYVLKEPQVWQEVCGQYNELIEDIEPNLRDYIYLVGHVNMDIIGLFIIHGSEYGYKCHVQVLPEHRKEHALEFGKKVIDWTWNNTDINKLIALIPQKFPNVIGFAETQGFKDLGPIGQDHFMVLEK